MDAEKPTCRICGTTELLLRCAKCKTAHYCSATHQHRDWADHRQQCKELARAKRESQANRVLNGANNFNCSENTQQPPPVQQVQVMAVAPSPQPVELHPPHHSAVAENEMLNTQAVVFTPNASASDLLLGPTEMNIDRSAAFSFGRNDENCMLPPQMMDASERRYEDLCENVINDMNTYGLSVIDDFLGMDKGLQILNEVHRMYEAGVFKDGQLVSNSSAGRNLRTIRGDKIAWVKGVEAGCSNIGYLINQIDAVICRANTMNENGLLGNYKIRERTKAMVACYPGSGSHYLMHVDNPNRDGRVITAIYYLNVNWDTRRSGGILRICPEHDGGVADIEPKFDRLIFFWSDRRNPHEVQPAHRTRYAITVWYFDANEREMALNRVRHSNCT